MKTENKIQKIIREATENNLTTRQINALFKCYALTAAEKEGVKMAIREHNIKGYNNR